ncbi:MAG: hypothetical protein WDN08_20905 [Rhizomicrobium sp.]
MSRWLVGSSSTAMSGSPSFAAAMRRSRCQPPESSPKFFAAISSGMRRSSSRTSTFQVSSREIRRQRALQEIAHRDAGEIGGISCGTKPTRVPRLRTIWPLDNSSSPDRHLSSVDLPAPFSPTSAVRASSSWNDTFSKIVVTPNWKPPRSMPSTGPSEEP